MGGPGQVLQESDMDVISLEFILFVIITFALYWIIPARSRWLVLLGASLYFYYTYSITYLFILLAVSVVSFLAALPCSEIAGKASGQKG